MDSPICGITTSVLINSPTTNRSSGCEITNQFQQDWLKSFHDSLD
jgi:hypothetical protein